MESVSILEGKGFSRAKSLSIVDKAVIEVHSSKHSRIYQSDWAEPATADMDIGYATTRDAHIQDLNYVWWDSIGKWGRWALKYRYIILWASCSYAICVTIICFKITKWWFLGVTKSKERVCMSRHSNSLIEPDA